MFPVDDASNGLVRGISDVGGVNGVVVAGVRVIEIADSSRTHIPALGQVHRRQFCERTLFDIVTSQLLAAYVEHVQHVRIVSTEVPHFCRGVVVSVARISSIADRRVFVWTTYEQAPAVLNVVALRVETEERGASAAALLRQ